ncbi:Major facilitator superfamily domain, general substrate transporter [Artemisia annua]|uniref:Major facilitator superfamily domain, general substrate transporter n=1 Tax=Artemisia annua TaxID=35608 RepID=A0A2U1KEB3_ARTAN|nr:Major facilitator superfamily domain, general substrate transporter [Artemisia annua]
MPESLRTVASAVFFISLSISSYLSSFIVNIIHKLSRTDGGMSWLGGHDLNKNRLDYCYYIIAGFGVLNLIYFTLFGSKFLAPTKVVGAEELQLVEVDAHIGGNMSGRQDEV